MVQKGVFTSFKKPLKIGLKTIKYSLVKFATRLL